MEGGDQGMKTESPAIYLSADSLYMDKPLIPSRQYQPPYPFLATFYTAVLCRRQVLSVGIMPPF